MAQANLLDLDFPAETTSRETPLKSPLSPNEDEFYSPREPLSPPQGSRPPSNVASPPLATTVNTAAPAARSGTAVDSLTSRFKMGFSGLGFSSGAPAAGPGAAAKPSVPPVPETRESVGGPDLSGPPPVASTSAAPATAASGTFTSRLAKGFETFGVGTMRAARQMGGTINTLGQSLVKAVAVRRVTLANQCKKEASERPCPRTVLICCNALVVAGTSTPGLFTAQPERPELVQNLLQHLEASQGATLLPEWASPLVIAAALKAFLQQLPEPLLTYRLYRDFIAAAAQPSSSLDLLSELPLSALNTFEVLLETCHRLTRQPERNGITTRKLAEALAPALLWPPLEAAAVAPGAAPAPTAPSATFPGGAGGLPRQSASSQVSTEGAEGTMLVPAEQRTMPDEDLEAATRVCQYLIANFRNPEGYLSN